LTMVFKLMESAAKKWQTLTVRCLRKGKCRRKLNLNIGPLDEMWNRGTELRNKNDSIRQTN
ncbi:MAG: hypothetical protein AABZ47_10995, partial [Planctomycetota bacterium]